MSRLRRYAPDWAIVAGIAGAIGAASAIVAVAVYREVVIGKDGALWVPSDVQDSE